MQTAQINARQQFDSVTDRLETQWKNRPTDFFDFILADAELVRSRNKDECKRITEIQVGGGSPSVHQIAPLLQSHVAEQLGSSLENMENEQRTAVSKQRTVPSPSKSLK